MKNYLNLPFILLIKFYRFFISPFFSGSCKFEPSCSSYALECFKNYNLIKAFYKTIIRIFKCNPWFNTGGIDKSFKEDNK
tara:strand:- start:23 stop:262 length:240 start_codon:yes stop_codon:yes gene_type:complete